LGHKHSTFLRVRAVTCVSPTQQISDMSTNFPLLRVQESGCTIGLPSHFAVREGHLAPPFFPSVAWETNS